MWQLFLHLSDGYLIGMLAWLVSLGGCPILLMRLRRRWKSYTGRVRLVMAGFSFWVLLASLTIVELGFALLYDTTDSFDMTNVSHRWFEVHVSPDVKTLEFSDGTGIRYRARLPFPAKSPKPRRHVCFLGDSFTFGHGVPDVANRFSDRCQEKLTDTVVSNLAWPGTDLLWHESVLKHAFESGIRIDDAVYVLCLNDIEAFHDPTMSRSTQLSHFEPPGFLFRDTYFFNWIYFRSQLLIRPDVKSYYDFVNDYYSGETLNRFRTTLERTSTLCAENDCRFSVVVFPFLHNLSTNNEFSVAHERIADACVRLSIPYLDLQPTLLSHVGDGLTVNPFDAHPNARAHHLAAEAISGKLLQRRE
jgi:hypothetical protein